MTKTTDRTAVKTNEAAENRKRQETKQKNKIERDKKLIVINVDYDAKLARVQEERAAKLKAVWDEWYAS